MGREPILQAACGKKGVGKTVETAKRVRKYIINPGRKVLVFDANNEFSDKVKYPDFRRIALKDIPEYALQKRPEIRVVAPFFDNNKKMTLDDMSMVLQWIIDNFKDGLLWIEDINKYISDSMPGDLIGAICTNRHSGLDIIMQYQSIGRLVPKIWQNINVLRMHRNTDGVEKNKNKLADKFEIMKIAENIIDQEFRAGNGRFFLHVNFDDEKIHADVDDEKKKTAIMNYIYEYPSVYSALLNKEDETGKALGKKAAQLEKAADLFSLYF